MSFFATELFTQRLCEWMTKGETYDSTVMAFVQKAIEVWSYLPEDSAMSPNVTYAWDNGLHTVIGVQLIGAAAVEIHTRVDGYAAVTMLDEHGHKKMELNALPSHITGLVLKSNTVWKDRVQQMTKCGKIDTLKKYMPELHAMLVWASQQCPPKVDLDTIERFQQAANDITQYHSRCYDGAPDNLERLIIRGGNSVGDSAAGFRGGVEGPKLATRMR